MLKLRRGVVVGLEPLLVEVGGQKRQAWSDPGLHCKPQIGDEVIVNTVAIDLELGSGGFDIVHVNLTRGLADEGRDDEHVIKLNYSSLQHPVAPVEALVAEYDFEEEGAVHGRPEAGQMPALILPLHGHLAPAAFAAAQAYPGLKVGFIQANGGALPGRLSRDVSALLQRDLLCGHITAGTSYGGQHEAITLAGALDAAQAALGWDLALVGPGPGILGSATRLGHGGLAALDAAHAALALGLPTVISPRLSQGDPRPRHRGLSHHSATVLKLLLAPLSVAVPAGEDEIVAAVEAIESRGGRHQVRIAAVDLEGYASAGLPRRTMGRDIEDDPLFFAAPLSAGRVAAAEAEARG